MAVIITDMDMPKACCTQIEVIPGYCTSVFCKLYECCPNKDIYNVNTKPNDCPCKSADEMIKEIENINDWAIRYAPTETKDKRPQIVAKVKKHIISIIHKYTDKEYENEN